MALSKAQVDEIARMLDERYESLRRDVSEEVKASGDTEAIERFVDTPADTGDRALSDLLSDLNLAIVDRHVHEMRGIEAARERMAEGSYGVCIDCGDDIGFQRLKVNPTAQRCIRDQERFEKTHAFEGMGTPRL
jgi:RNA polymerase-binding protein DksA